MRGYLATPHRMHVVKRYTVRSSDTEMPMSLQRLASSEVSASTEYKAKHRNSEVDSSMWLARWISLSVRRHGRGTRA